MAQYPEKLAELAADFALISDRNERIEYLIEIADRFDTVRVTPGIAAQPYDEAHRAPACESEAFVWAVDQADGGLRYVFDVLNPQGLSAQAFAVVLGETLVDAPVEAIANLSDEIVFDLFGREISMGKGAGLMGILTLVRHEAKRRLTATGSQP